MLLVALIALTAGSTKSNSSIVTALSVIATATILIGLLWLLARARSRVAHHEARAMDKTLKLALADLDAERVRLGPGFDAGPDVRFEFYTYSGFLIFTSQRRHHFVLPKELALFLLKRLHRQNIRRGLLAKGGLFIPLVSWITLVQQRRSIRRQLKSIR